MVASASACKGQYTVRNGSLPSNPGGGARGKASEGLRQHALPPYSTIVLCSDNTNFFVGYVHVWRLFVPNYATMDDESLQSPAPTSHVRISQEDLAIFMDISVGRARKLSLGKGF